NRMHEMRLHTKPTGRQRRPRPVLIRPKPSPSDQGKQKAAKQGHSRRDSASYLAVNRGKVRLLRTFSILFARDPRNRRSETCCHRAEGASACGPCHYPPFDLRSHWLVLCRITMCG